MAGGQGELWVLHEGGREMRERSAGIIVFRIDDDARRYLLLDYGKYYEFPKGHLEPGEDDLTAALRELDEETGITSVQLVEGYKREITYYYRAKRRQRAARMVPSGVVRKDVCFFLARTKEKKVRISDEHVGYVWLSYDKALARLKYPTAKELLTLAEAHLAQRAELADVQ